MTDPFAVVRQAHRICGAYYQQIFPLLKETADKLETSFVYWSTWSFRAPPQRNKNPFESWKWDYLPVMDLSVLFSRQQEPGTPMMRNDFALEFKLVTDSELSYDQRVENYGENEEPDAIRLKVSPKEAESYLSVYLFSAATDDALYPSPYNLWDDYEGYPDVDARVHLSNNEKIKGIGFTLSLNEITADHNGDILVCKINENLALLMSSLQK